MDIGITELLLVALVTGFGAGVGNPIGQFFYKKYLEPRLERVHDKIRNVKDKIRDTPPMRFPSEERMREIINEQINKLGGISEKKEK